MASTEIQRHYEEKSFGKIFSIPNVEYEIPFFQRGYVWDKAKWQELLNMVILGEICGLETLETDNVAKIKDNLNKIEEKNEEELKKANYYFGSIYLKTKDNPSSAPGDIQRYLVIDGQQRLITIYLFLVKLYYDLNQDDNYRKKMIDYGEYLFNKEENHKSKIFTLKADEQDLIAIIANNNTFNPHIQGNISAFNNWYETRIKHILLTIKYNLFIALYNSLKVTEIILSKEDDEMLIFENLNDKGTPLRGDELLCSYIFQPIIKNKTEKEVQTIHNDYWLKLYEEINQINLEAKGTKIKANEHFLFFLRHKFSIGKNKMVGKDKQIYYNFKRDNHKPDSENMMLELKSIKEHVLLFKKSIVPDNYKDVIGNEETIDLLIKIQQLKMYTNLTFIMPLINELEKNSGFLDEANQLLKTLYIFLVRRSIAKLKTTEDNTIFPMLWNDIKYEKNKIEIMKNKFRDKDLLVSDTDLQDKLNGVDFYNNSLKVFFLIEIDKRLTDNNNWGEYPDYTKLNTVEHILPQSFDKDKDEVSKNWKEYLKSEYTKNIKYDEILTNKLNTIGNLLLVGPKRNSSLSADIFPNKLSKYESNSGLSKDLKDNYANEEWNHETIEKRSQALAKIACTIWAWPE